MIFLLKKKKSASDHDEELFFRYSGA